MSIRRTRGEEIPAPSAAAPRPPLAERMRPRNLDEFVGQEHILGPGRLLRRAIQADRITSVIFSGPPGTGKTTLARIIAGSTQSQFLAINAVLAGIKDIREAIESAQEARRRGQGTLLFVDEVHRFNKAQQDALLPHVENGTLILIGATTENPFFEVNKALVSRSRIFQLRSLEDADIRRALEQALRDPGRGYGSLRVEIDPAALDHLVRMAQGDARSALNALELAVETTPPDAAGLVRITLPVAEESIQRKAVLYDKEGDAHYDSISAFIKSVRGSDPDAALYWLAKMVEAGEDPRFLFRRMAILAAEDVGLADPAALGVVMAAAAAFDYVGFPEGQFHLSQACLYLSTAPKSNSAMGYFDALETVRQERIGEVPDPLKDGNRDAELGHGSGYLYPHAYRDHWVAQQYLPEGLKGRVFYEPGASGHEAGLREEVWRRREAQLAAVESGTSVAPAPGRRGWLDRAAAAGSEAWKTLRDDLCEAAALRRESLALDLGGHHGFLTWELLRRCVEGGVWTRCEDAVQAEEMEGWLRRLAPLHSPRLWVASWNGLPAAAESLPEKPAFDVVLGLLPPPVTATWMSALSLSFGRSARWVLAFRREAPLPSEWIRAAGGGEEFQSESAGPEGEGLRLERELREAGWETLRREKVYPDPRRLTPSQAMEWIARSAVRSSHPLAAYRAGHPSAWEPFARRLADYLSSGMRAFPAAFDLVAARPPA